MVHLSYVSREHGMAAPITYTPCHLCHVSLWVILQRLSVSLTISPCLSVCLDGSVPLSLYLSVSFIMSPSLLLKHTHTHAHTDIHTHTLTLFCKRRLSTLILFIERDRADIKEPVAK